MALVQGKQPLPTPDFSLACLEPEFAAGHAAPAATHNRAVGYYLAEDHSATEATIRRNIRDYPEDPRAYLWLAAALGLLGHSGAGAARNEAGYLR